MCKFILLLFILPILISCKPEVEPLFTMNLEVDFDIPAGLSNILTHTFVIRDIKNPKGAYLKTFGVEEQKISSIQAGRGEITSLFSTTDYDFVNKVSVWIVSSKDPDIRREMYYLDFNNNNSNKEGTLKLLSAVSNVKDLLDEETFDIEVKLEFRSFSPRFFENRLIFSLIALE